MMSTKARGTEEGYKYKMQVQNTKNRTGQGIGYYYFNLTKDGGTNI